MSDDNRSNTTRTGVTSSSERYFGGLLSLDERHFQRVFALLFAGFVAGVISISLTYDREASLFPLLVAIPTFVMLAVLLATQTIPPIRSYAERLGASPMLSEEIGNDDSDWQSGSDAPIETIRMNAVRVLGWIAFLAVSILLFGHVIGLTIALIAVFRYYSGLSWVRAIAFALVNVAFLVGLFLVFFNAQLYPGIFLG